MFYNCRVRRSGNFYYFVHIITLTINLHNYSQILYRETAGIVYSVRFRRNAVFSGRPYSGDKRRETHFE
jgi:hypothetical protein